MARSSRYITLFVPLCVAAALHGVSAGEAVDVNSESAVIMLDDSNFEHLTQASTGATTGTWFVAFTAPWCGHCKQMSGAWEAVAKELKGVVVFGKVDGTQNHDLAERFDIRAFPTLILFNNGKMYEYEGERRPKPLAVFARGGFSQQTGVAVPAEKSLVGKWLGHFVEGWESTRTELLSVVQTHTNSTVVILCVGLALGVVITAILFSAVNRLIPMAPTTGQVPPSSARPVSRTEDRAEEPQNDAEDSGLRARKTGSAAQEPASPSAKASK